jgi:hypothetical protein
MVVSPNGSFGVLNANKIPVGATGNSSYDKFNHSDNCKFDDNLTWQSNTASGKSEWLMYDFGNPYYLSSFYIRTAIKKHEDLSVEVSNDNTKWTKIHNFDNTKWSNITQNGVVCECYQSSINVTAPVRC